MVRISKQSSIIPYSLIVLCMVVTMTLLYVHYSLPYCRVCHGSSICYLSHFPLWWFFLLLLLMSFLLLYFIWNVGLQLCFLFRMSITSKQLCCGLVLARNPLSHHYMMLSCARCGGDQCTGLLSVMSAYQHFSQQERRTQKLTHVCWSKYTSI